MSMMKKNVKLNIKEIVGINTVSRDHGRKIRDIIEPLLKTNDKITIDFSNLLIASPSFIDEAFAKLFLEYPLAELKGKLSFVNITEFDRALLNDLVRSRIKEYDSLKNTPLKGGVQSTLKKIKQN